MPLNGEKLKNINLINPFTSFLKIWFLIKSKLFINQHLYFLAMIHFYKHLLELNLAVIISKEYLRQQSAGFILKKQKLLKIKRKVIFL